MKNKLMGILICLSMIVCLFPVRVSAAEPTTTVVLGDELNADVATSLTSVTDLDAADRTLTEVAASVTLNKTDIANAEGIVLTVGAAEVEAALEAGTTVDAAAFETLYVSLIKQIREINPTAILVVGELVAPADASAELTAALAAVNGVIVKYESTYFYDVVETGAITLTSGDITLDSETTYVSNINGEFTKDYPSSFKVTFEGKDTNLNFGEYYEHQAPTKSFTITNTGAQATVVALPALEGLTITTTASKNVFGAYTLGAGASITFDAKGPSVTRGTTLNVNTLGNEGLAIGVSATVKESTKITLLPGFEGGKTLEFYIGEGQTMADVFEGNAELKTAIENYIRAGYELRGFYEFTEADDEITLSNRIFKASLGFDATGAATYVTGDAWSSTAAELELMASWRVAEYKITISYEDAKTGDIIDIPVNGTNMNDILGDLGDGISYDPITNTLTIEGDQSAYTVDTGMESLTIKGVNGKIADVYSAGKLVITGTLNSEIIAANEEVTVDKAANVTTEFINANDVTVNGSLTGNANNDTAIKVENILKVAGSVTVNADNQVGIAAKIIKILATGVVSVDNASKGAELIGIVGAYREDQPEFSIEKGGKYTTTNTDTAILVHAFTRDDKVVLDKDKVINLPEGYLAADEEVKMFVDNEGTPKYPDYVVRYTLGKVGQDAYTSYYENTLMVGGSLGNVALPQGTAATTPSTPATPDASTPGAGSTTIPNVSTGDDIMVWSGLLVVSLASLGLCVRSFAKEN